MAPGATFSKLPKFFLRFPKKWAPGFLVEMGIEPNRTRGHEESYPNKNPVVWVMMYEKF